MTETACARCEKRGHVEYRPLFRQMLCPQCLTKARRGVHFDGPLYEPALDKARLLRQIDRIYDLMKDQRWRTLAEIALGANAPEASVSAQLRNLRKKRFGGYVVESERIMGGRCYRVLEPFRLEG